MNSIVNERSASTEEELFDFMDGSFCKQHAIFKNSCSIQILGYYDDAEIVNPIGVHTKKTY